VRAFWLLVSLRVAEVRRSGAGLFFYIVLPLMLMAVVGLVFMNGHPFERHRVALVGPASAVSGASGALARFGDLRLVRLEDAGRGARTARGMLKSRELNVVVVPDGIGSGAAPAPGAGAGAGAGAGDAAPGGEGRGGALRVLVGSRDELLARGLVSVLPPGARVELVDVPRWGYVHFLFPGLLTFTALISGFFGMGYPMVRYRESLFLKKLATTPLPRSVFIASQMSARAALTLAQVAMMVVVARLAFGLPVELAALPWITALSTLGILVFMGMGFLLACFIKSESTMVDAINVVTMPFVFLSEIFFSADELPGPLPMIASALPSTQLVRLLRAVMLHGELRPEVLLPGVLIVAAWTVAMYGLSLALFRWHE
jgi:ABC-2 type transport system permease protein